MKIGEDFFIKIRQRYCSQTYISTLFLLYLGWTTLIMWKDKMSETANFIVKIFK